MQKFFSTSRIGLLALFALIYFGLSSCTKACDTKETHTLTLQPGSKEGQDAIVATRQFDNGANATANHSYIPELSLSRWTYNALGWGEGTNRTYLKFTGLASLPANTEIVSAKLSLYGLSEQETKQSPSTPQGNSYYNGSPYPGTNPGWIRRVTGGDWEQTTITWMNKPATTDVHQVAIPASGSQYGYDATDLDVTNLVKDILGDGHNYGFCLQLKTEAIYRSLLFASSEFSDASKRPRLVVTYRK